MRRSHSKYPKFRMLTWICDLVFRIFLRGSYRIRDMVENASISDGVTNTSMYPATMRWLRMCLGSIPALLTAAGIGFWSVARNESSMEISEFHREYTCNSHGWVRNGRKCCENTNWGKYWCIMHCSGVPLRKTGDLDDLLLQITSQLNPKNQITNPRQHSEFRIFGVWSPHLAEVSRVLAYSVWSRRTSTKRRDTRICR